jgi:type IV pilus assembly protein PilY1
MKKMQCLILFFVTSLMGYSAALHAEDTDIYVDNAANDGVPNVLFVMDNGANFSANAKIGCSFYSGTSEAPSLDATTGAGIEQCALVQAIQGLPDGAVNIGILVSNANRFATDVRNAGDPAYHEQCVTDIGGCLLRKLTYMDARGKENLINFIKSWRLSGPNSATQFTIKVNAATSATMMQEAWAYYRGRVGMSGKDYRESVLASGCQTSSSTSRTGKRAPPWNLTRRHTTARMP